MSPTVRIKDGWKLLDSEGAEVGSILAEENVLKKLEIAPDYRQQGFGRAAFHAFLDQCKRNGYDEAYVMMVVNDFMGAIVVESGYPWEEVDDEAVPVPTPDGTAPTTPNYRIDLS